MSTPIPTGPKHIISLLLKHNAQDIEASLLKNEEEEHRRP